jgi:hypothetical protein
VLKELFDGAASTFEERFVGQGLEASAGQPEGEQDMLSVVRDEVAMKLRPRPADRAPIQKHGARPLESEIPGVAILEAEATVQEKTVESTEQEAGFSQHREGPFVGIGDEG